jgi:hypothetical protein
VSLWRWLWRWLYWLLGQEAVRLNLRVFRPWITRGDLQRLKRGHKVMAKIGDTLNAKIEPKNAAGVAAPVSGVVWSLDDAGNASWDLVHSADGMSAVVTAKALSLGFGGVLTVTATTKGGATLTESAQLPVVEGPDEEAVTLNLSVA